MSHRNKLLTLKIASEEREQWRAWAEAQNMTIADYIRTSVGAQQVGRVPLSRSAGKRNKADPELIGQLGRIGNNLNQIGRWCNAHKSDADAEQVILVLIAIERDLQELKWEFGTYAH